MRISPRRISLGHRTLLALCAACLVFLAFASTTLAAGSVTVRVEGLTETKLLPTQVTLTGTPVVKDGNVEHACGGNTGVGALQLATGGNWTGPWNSGFKQYEIYSIEGENHVFEKGAPANYFWSFWLNDKESEVGACEAEVKAGDHVLFFPSCFGTACPQPTPTPLEVEAASSADVGEPTPVTVRRFSSSGVASEVAGAAVVGGGAGATTDSHGHAMLTFSHPGEITVRATAPEAIRTETTICVHNGNDGTCGTTQPIIACAAASATSCPELPRIVFPPLLDVAKVVGVKNGHAYSRRHAPRVLGGIVKVPAGGTLRQVRIRLERRYRGRCWDFSGSRVRFVRARKCGTASFFSVGGSESFSYLLPAPLPQGRYVYDIEGVDSAGHPTKLVSGVSHVVFRVK
jgi:hypothetical protein